MSSQKKQFSHLPTDVVPINYDIWLKPCLSTFVFFGNQTVNVQVNHPTSTISMNSSDIVVFSGSFTTDEGLEIPVANISYNTAEERIIFRFSDTLTTGKGNLTITFKGNINERMKGFHKSKYISLDGKEKYAAVTHFEATSARYCFPCWDEPQFKATFNSTLVIEKNLVGLSNTEVVQEKVYEENSNFKVIKFASTPLISTYIVAYVVGEYDYVEDFTVDGLKVRVYTPVGKTKQGKFALDVAVKALPFYKEYFGINYPLNKMDLIAISDLAIGAMENWGLVTYREPLLLCDDSSSSALTRQLVSLVVSHELAHLWFGNLVTMEWWTHLWLKEGFANFMEYLSTDHCHPEFDIWTQFLSHDFARAMNLDALDNSHPIEIPVGHPDEVGEIFDTISYSKGACILRMLHNWLGDKDFRSGLHSYLSKHAYKNASTEDLWDALGKASGKLVRKVMSTWTKQMGYPVLDVQCKSRTDNSITLVIKQSKFRANVIEQKDDAPFWLIPVSFSTQSSPHTPVKSILMEDTVTEVTIENVPSDGWVKVNPGTYGFYRVRYSDELLSALLPAVRSRALHARDRLALQSDIFALASSGFVPTTDYLKTLAAYENETDYTVWSDVNGKIGSLFTLLWNDDNAYELFKKFSLKLFKNVLNTLGWIPMEGEGHQENMLRSLVISRLGKCGSEEVLNESQKRFSDHIDQSSPLLADLREAVYGNILSSGRRKDLETMFLLHNNSDFREERTRIERSLGCVSDEELMDEVLKFSMSEHVRGNDRVFLISSLATCHKEGRDLAWKFVKDNWDKFFAMYKGQFFIARLVKNTTENFSDESMAKDVKEFFDNNSVDGGERTVQQSLEQIKRNTDWWKRDGAVIKKWLKENY